MFYGHKECWAGCLTGELVEGHEKLAGFGEKRGAGGLGRLGPALAPWYDARATTTTGSARRDYDSLGLCCWCIFSSAGSKEEIVLWEAPRVGVLPAYGGRYSPARPSCGVLGCPTEYPTPRTSTAMTTLIQTFWLKSSRSHNGYGTPKVLSTATVALRVPFSHSSPS